MSDYSGENWISIDQLKHVFMKCILVFKEQQWKLMCPICECQ